MSRRAEKTCIGGLVLQTLCALGCFVLAKTTNSRAAFAEAWHFALGIGVWLLALLHVSFRRAAIEEKLDEEAVRRRQGERAKGIFGAEGAADEFSARARLERVEKWLVPFGSLLFGLGMVVVSALMLTGWGRPAEPVSGTLVGLMAFFAMVFLTFLVGRYTVGQSEEPGAELLRGPGGFMLFNTLCSVLVMAGMAFAEFGATALEQIVAWVIIVALGVIGAEFTLTFVANLYRPRPAAGREARAAYDSRLLGLLSMPKRILRSAAETLDYQFGFKVSETWFFRFLERALAPLILFLLVTLYLLTSVLVVPAGHLAFIERFGAARSDADGAPAVYRPGLHLKWPWPIEISRVVATDRVQQIVLGVHGGETGLDEYDRKIARGEQAELPPLVWTRPHYEQEYNLIVATDEPDIRDVELTEGGRTVRVPPVSLVTVSLPVQFVVREHELAKYVYGYTDVAAALEAVAYRELVQYVAGADLIRLLGPDREQAGEDLQQRIQVAADAAGLGVDVVFVGLHGVHPHFQVAPSFEARVSALEERKTEIIDGETYAVGLRPTSEAERAKIVNTAKAERFSKRILAWARADRFKTLDAAYRKAPDIFRLRRYLTELEDVLPGRKLVVASPEVLGDGILILDLTEKLGRQLLGLSDMTGTTEETRP
ncbi:MAG: hypothetical protein JW889_13550 [Verrucomicrobia bacterium]|nr:hypothetical protein [Verrucomicrobiota bacterium]